MRSMPSSTILPGAAGRAAASGHSGPGVAPWVRILAATGLPLFTAAGLAGAALRIHLNGYLADGLLVLSLASARWILLDLLAVGIGAIAVAALAAAVLEARGARPSTTAASLLVIMAGSLTAVLAVEFRPSPYWSTRAWEVLKLIQGLLGPLGALIGRRSFRLLALALASAAAAWLLYAVASRLLARPAPAARLAGLLRVTRMGKLPRLAMGLSLAAAAVVSGSSLALDAARRPAGPSVLLITTDTLRADHLEIYGGSRATAPAIARLAARGTVFHQAIAQAPWTLPSIASIVTGRYPREHGAVYPNLRVPEDQTLLAEYLRDASYRTAVVTSWLFVSRPHGFAQGVDRFERIRVDEKARDETAPQITDRGLRFLREEGAGRPFFLWLHYTEPHEPYLAHQGIDYAGGYDGPLTEPLTVRQLYRRRDRMTDADRAFARDLYDGEITAMDREIGRLVEGLDSLGLAGSTLIVLVGDHGEEFGDHGGFGHHHQLHQELIRVPLVIVDPSGRGAGWAVRRTVEIRHLARTILDITGVKAPRLGGVDLMESYDGHLETFAFSEHYDRWTRKEEGTAVLGRGWKRIDHLATGAFELYDLGADPGESRDLSEGGDPEAADMARLLEREMERFKRRGGAAAGEAALDEEEMERLRSLGYVE